MNGCEKCELSKAVSAEIHGTVFLRCTVKGRIVATVPEGKAGVAGAAPIPKWCPKEAKE